MRSPRERRAPTGRTDDARAGHGVYDLGFDRCWLLRPGLHLTVTEGIAILRASPRRANGWRDAGGLPGRRRGARRAPARGEGRGAPGLHALGPKEDHFRAVVPDPEEGLLRDGGARLLATSCLHVRRGRPFSTWPRASASLRPWSARITTGGPRRPRRRPDRVGGAGRATSRGQAFSPRRCSPARSVRWDKLLEEATGEPPTWAAHAAADARGLGTRIRGPQVFNHGASWARSSSGSSVRSAEVPGRCRRPTSASSSRLSPARPRCTERPDEPSSAAFASRWTSLRMSRAWIQTRLSWPRRRSPRGPPGGEAQLYNWHPAGNLLSFD